MTGELQRIPAVATFSSLHWGVPWGKEAETQDSLSLHLLPLGEETETEVEGLVIIWVTEEDGHTANAASLALSGWIWQ